MILDILNLILNIQIRHDFGHLKSDFEHMLFIHHNFDHNFWTSHRGLELTENDTQMPDVDAFHLADQHADLHILLKEKIKKIRLYESPSFYTK